MKIKTIGTKIVCDCCGKQFETSDGFIAYNDDEHGDLIRQDAENNDWIGIQEQDFCPDCYEIDENDNIKINDGRIYDGENYELLKGGVQ